MPIFPCIVKMLTLLSIPYHLMYYGIKTQAIIEITRPRQQREWAGARIAVGDYYNGSTQTQLKSPVFMLTERKRTTFNDRGYCVQVHVPRFYAEKLLSIILTCSFVEIILHISRHRFFLSGI